MDSAASAGYAAFGIFFVIFGFILAILWILVPFAVFGIKGLLKQLISEQRKTNQALTTISQQIHVVAEAYLRAPAARPAAAPPPPVDPLS